MGKGSQPGIGSRLIESWFPYVEISHLVAADRRRKDPVYGVHKWFARRPPTLVRALLLASQLSNDAVADEADVQGNGNPQEEFWIKHGNAGPWLAGARTYDPFMGGGTSLVESARMGAHVAGRDVDPIAVAVVGSELHGPAEDFEQAYESLAKKLNTEFGAYYAGPDNDWMPLHWFWLVRPVCGGCGEAGLLYKDLILATSTGRNGAVRRENGMHAFCPDCLTVHAISASRIQLRCCGRYHKIHSGTFVRARYRCPSCEMPSTFEDLQVAVAPRVMVAVEETHSTQRRRIRTATWFDRLRAEGRATSCGGSVVEDQVTDALSKPYDLPLATNRRDRRPVSAGYTSTRTLFTSRQWALFTAAFEHVRAGNYDAHLERDLTLMLTGALSANNVLCGYARDWGRLAPLFSVRGFSIPALSVELNPFHPKAGRGTFRSAKARITERSKTEVRRAQPHVSHPNQTVELTIDLPVAPASVDLVCRSADDTKDQNKHLSTMCVTDPPYFDYIAYSELSEFFRSWLRAPGLGGEPLLPDVDPEDAVESFANGLGAALKATVARLAAGTPLVFTYHSANPDAWTAIGDAFDISDLSVVALWPVLADPHMGHHVAEGNCEWDVIVVARCDDEVVEIDAPGDPTASWLEAIEAGALHVGEADQRNFELAWEMASQRFATSVTAPAHRGSLGKPAGFRQQPNSNS
ncbi:MAG: hypothetical protein ACOYEV_13260 [Candidatus Nanopelagicales bacterium]